MSEKNGKPEPTFKEWTQAWEARLVLMEKGDTRTYNITREAFKLAVGLIEYNSQYPDDLQLGLKDASDAIKSACRQVSLFKEFIYGFTSDIFNDFARGDGMDFLEDIQKRRKVARVEKAKATVAAFNQKYDGRRYHHRPFVKDTMGPKSRGLHKLVKQRIF